MEEMTMKKIFLALAAVAALASCVKENAPVLDQDNDNLVTITALATKTTLDLDGTSVVWDADDEIGVVYDNGNNETVVGFSTTESGSPVKFTGEHPDGYMETTSAYAVYPSSSVTLDGGVKISHNLPEVQTGVVTPGMILSSALLDADDLKAGNATAQFHNALALVKVIVPADVQSVTLTSDMLSGSLVGRSIFNAPDEDGVMLKNTEVSIRRTVTLSTGSELAVGTHDLLV